MARRAGRTDVPRRAAAHPLLASIALVATVVLVATGVWLTRSRSAGNAGPAGLALPAGLAADATGALNRSWTLAGSQEGGYGDSSLNAPPSLYTTAWSLHLAVRLRITLPPLDRDRCAAWLDSVLASPRRNPDGLPELQAVNLAAQALVDLGAPPPARLVATDIEQLRAGGEYRSSPDAAPSWPATATAAATLQMAGLPVPGEVSRAAWNTLKRQTPAQDLDTWASDILPPWQVIAQTTSPAVREPLTRPFRDALLRLEPELSAWRQTTQTLSVLHEIEQVTRLDGLPAPHLPTYALDRLTGPNGLLTLISGQPAWDPQLTSDALDLGWTAPPVLASTVRQTEGTTGWAAATPLPDPDSSYYAIMLHGTDQPPQRRTQLRRLTTWWIGQLTPSRPLAQLRAHASQEFHVLELALLLHVPVPAAARAALAQAATPAAASTDTSTLLWQVRLARALGLAPWPHLPTVVQAPRGSALGTSMLQAALLAEAAEWSGDASLQRQAIQITAQLCDRDGCRPAAQAPGTDLASTVTGAAITEASHQWRLIALSRFSDSQGAWLNPAAEHQGNLQDLHTFYLAAQLWQPTAPDLQTI